MPHTYLDDHLEDLCPNCKEHHSKAWTTEFDKFSFYKRTSCSSCGYVIFKKKKFMSCGKRPEFID